MEWKIGEIKQVNGEWYQCVEGTNACIECDFKSSKECALEPSLNCLRSERKDKTHVIFKKLEKVGEPYLFQGRTFQTYNVFIEPSVSEDIGLIIIPSKNINTVEIEIKQNEEDMEEGKLDPHMEKVIDEAAQKLGDEISKQLKENLNKQRMKPFNLEAAKAGKPVCTRDGRKARIICFDKKEGAPIVALVETEKNERISEEITLYFINGRLISENLESKDDLMMLPEKKEGWINIYERDYPYTDEEIFDTRKQAEDCCKNSPQKVAIIKIEWEE